MHIPSSVLARPRLALLAVLVFAIPAQAKASDKLQVITTLPELATIVSAIGGDHVTVEALITGAQDPHRIDAKPSLMAKLAEADLYVEIGLELELWSANVLEGARNPRIMPGEAGHLVASKGVNLLEKPAVASRSEGDMHPYGNPHIWLDPLNLLVMGDNVLAGLVALAPQHEADFTANRDAFAREIQEMLFGAELVKLLGGDVLVRLAKKGELFDFLEKKKLKGEPLIGRLGGLLKAAEPMRGKPIVFYHQSWVYFATRFGLDVAAYVEEKPGIPPSAAHRDHLVELFASREIPVIAITSYYDDALAAKVAKQTGAKLVVVPQSVGGLKGVDTYTQLMSFLVENIATEYR